MLLSVFLEHYKEDNQDGKTFRYDIEVKDYNFNHQPHTLILKCFIALGFIFEVDYLDVNVDTCCVATPALETTF